MRRREVRPPHSFLCGTGCMHQEKPPGKRGGLACGPRPLTASPWGKGLVSGEEKAKEGKGMVGKRLRRPLMAAGALILTAGFFWWAFWAPAGTVFQLDDRDRGRVVLSVPVKAGDKLSLEIEHSFEHIPWYEYYTVTEDFQFNLDAIAVAGYGAGIPAEMDVPTRIEGGLVWMEGINSVFPKFSWITSDQYMKVFTLNEKEIFDFRSLPDASRIRGEIIKKRGYLSDV